ncbi:hypothetical protein EIK77_005212 [Talaromyces pinophilus]|nr:hypothetical protein EIK77_005212 [Talaromyces pinophilus]
MFNIPCDRSPRRSEKEDVDTNESNSCLLSILIMDNDVSKRILTGGSRSKDGNEQLRDGHANCSREQDWASSPLVNSIKTRNSRTDINATSNQTNDKLILESRVLKELCAVVKYEVNTGQLLKGLEQASGQKALPKTTLETLNVTSTSNA